MTRDTLIQLLADVREDGRPLGWHAGRIRKFLEHGEPVAPEYWVGPCHWSPTQWALWEQNVDGKPSGCTCQPVPLYATPIPSTPTSEEE